MAAPTPTPLSRSQQALWFIYREAPESAAYTMALPLQFAGEVDGQILQQAVLRLMERHAALRGSFFELDGVPYRQVVNEPKLFWQEVDASGFTEPMLMAALYRYSQRPFVLEENVFRTTLFQGARTTLLINLHHIAGDAASLAILGKELTAFYTAEKNGHAADVPSGAMDYGDYVRWEAEFLISKKGQRAEAYWQQQLAGDVPVLQLPTDYPRPPLQTFNGDSVRVEVPEELTAAIKNLAKAHKSTLFTVLFSAYQILLHRYSGQDDIWIGVPTSTPRNRAEFAAMVGYLVNPMIVRSELFKNDDLTFSRLIQHNGRQMLAGLYHQPYPFTQILEKLQPQRNPAYPPLMQTMFALERDDLIPKKYSADNVHARRLDIAQMEGQFDLTLTLSDGHGGKTLSAAWGYNRDLFKEATVARMAERLLILLQGAVDDAGQDIAKMPLLTDEEKAQLKQWNRTETDYPKDQTIINLFERQTAATPDSTAVVFENQTLGYAELNARVNRLAHMLIGRGVTTDAPVAIALERSPDMIIALLATLKAGGAYVPLDLDYPKDRLAFMLEDCGARILITRSTLRERLPQSAEHTILLDTEWAIIAQQPDSNPDLPVAPQDLAYIIYTSGSTGKPKGVALAHRGLHNLARAQIRSFYLTRSSRVLQFSSLSFDASVSETVMALCSGAALHLPDTEQRMPGPALLQHLEESAITHLTLPPTALAALPQAVLPKLESLVVAGEPCPPALAALWSKGRRFFNAYGPTEITVCATVAECAPSDIDTVTSLPIGRPIANTRLYVLDRHRQPTPIGVPGELHIGGVGLARGYLNRPELTAEKFIPDPFSAIPGARLYKTGDLVRYRPDGNLEFLGRLDHQVKIRGFRIELGEIEAALIAHPAIRETLVVARTDESGDKRLVAYSVATNGPEQTTAGDLRAFLKTTLPDYMLPAAFVFLDALPLTPNGKIDRKALPEPEQTTLPPTAAPRDPLEEIIAGLWSTVLRQPLPGIHDNFFELGGHSLLATQLASRLRDALGIVVPVRRLFEAPTVAELAESLRPILAGDGVETEEAAARTIPPLPRDRPPALSFAQQRLWFLDQLEGPSPTYNIPAVLELSGTLNIEALNFALSEIVRRHESLRTCLVMLNGEPVQNITLAHPLTLAVIDLRKHPDPEAEAKQRARKEATIPFDLALDPPLRAHLLQREDNAWTLLLTLHHSAADGWSITVLIRELVALYSARHEGQPSPLAEPAIQYADFAHWQRNYLSGERLQRQLEHWQTRLAGAPDCLNLPTDRPRPPRQSYRGSTVAFTIPPTITAGLKELSRRSGVTLFMTLLAAWANLLGRYSTEVDLVIGSPVANRTQSAIEPLIGFFVNTMALRADLSGNPTFLELLARIRHTCLEAYTHQEIPFESLVETLGVSRNLSHAPLFQVMFVLRNNAWETLALPGVNIALGESESTVAKFDLTLSIEETADVLKAGLEYAGDLFDRETIERMSGHLTEQLRSILANPEQPIRELNILPEAERRRLLIDWNGTATPQRETCVHQMFEVQVKQTPEATAVVFENQTLSYAELNARANQLAHTLIELGVEADEPVAIALERSPEMIVALLATLKAGGAYVPLDPDYPQERLAFMLEDSRARILITRESVRERLPRNAEHTILLDTDGTSIAQQPDDNPDRPVTAQQTAYIIYTSGSTGKPKGVAVEHRSICDHCQAIRTYFELSAKDRVLQFASFSFDASVEQILPTLCYGATLVLPVHGLNSPEALDNTLERFQISVAHLPPAFFEQWILQRRFCLTDSPLRLLKIGGDVLQKRLVSTWRAALPTKHNGIRLLNGYGPTEATVTTTFYEIPEVLSGNSVPIGRPLPHRTVYVLDRHRQPTPIGVPGELHIGGAGLARGYLNRPELTAERFIPDPFSATPGARLYKTGDLVRYRPDGNLEFLGRLDHQVKIRGFRIEPGEIEAALSVHPAIGKSVVIARTDETGDKRLVAYSVAINGPDPISAGDLRAFLKTTLPDYMLPSAFVFLDTLPLTPNGKIDRKALPEPGGRIAGERCKAPRDALERQLVQLWETLLSVYPIGIEDSFFEIGGHSLLAVRLVAEIDKRFGKRLPVSRLFEFPTVASIAALLRKEGGMPEASCLAAIRPQGSQTPLFFLPGAGGMVSHLYPLARLLDPEIPFFAFQAQGLDGKSAPHAGIEAMAEHYVTLLLEVQPHGPYFLAGHSFGGLVAFAMAQILLARGEAIGLLAMVDTHAPGAIADKAMPKLSDGQLLIKLINQTLVSWEDINGLTDEEQLAYVARRFEEADILPEGSGVDPLRWLLKIYNAHIRMGSRYLPESLRSVPITLFRASETMADQPPDVSTGEDFGWGRYSGRPVPIHYIPGNHMTMVMPPHVGILAQILNGLMKASPTPLSHSQQALWFIYREAPESAAYNMALPLQFTGEVDGRILQQAVRRLTERHPSLRSNFFELDGVPCQHVATEAKHYWQEVDASHWPRTGLMAALHHHSQQPFTLEEGAFRAVLFQGADTGTVLLLNLHHIAGDAASLAILGKELMAFYAAEDLPSMATDYGHYVRWEAGLLNGKKGRRMAAYWQQRLAGEVPVLQLPTDYPRPPLQTYNGASVRVKMPEELSGAVKNLAKTLKTSLFTVLFSAYQVLLKRYSGQDDIWIGVPTSTPRNQTEFADMVGYLVNPMIMRGEFSKDDSPGFNQLVRLNGRQMLTGLYHQPYPFTLLIERLQPQRNPAYPPLVQAMFALERDDLIPKIFSANGLLARSLDTAQMEGQFDLSLTFSDSDDARTLSAVWAYNRDLFKEATIARMAEHLHLLLQGAVADAGQDIAKMPLLTDTEKAQLKQWNQTETDYPKDQTLISLFERQVETTPDNLAVVFEDRSLSYRQLNDQANQLAHYLLSLKTAAGTALLAHNPLIAIALERSPEMVIGLLAIFKIGGAYVPIDPDYPSARIRDILDDSATPLLLTQSNTQTGLPLAGTRRDYVVLCLDEMDFTGQATENPAVNSLATDLAYVLYTSGSTGNPKGVMVGHQALALHIQAMLQQYRLTENDRVLQFASLSFDTSLEEMLVAWLSGACSMLLATNLIPASDLSALIKKHAITVADLPPAYWQQVIEITTITKDMASLGMLILGGEALPLRLAQQTRNLFPALTCFNAYGPTEAVITSCLYRLPAILADGTKYVAIGKPRANTHIYILDEQLHPQPLGIPGELCIAGACLARGYLNQPELSAEKFIEVELFGEPTRIYRTGDSARWLPDGNLEFLGRMDRQIKLRGFRIELGEIEAVLCRHPDIKEAVANLFEADGDPCIVAYLTTDNNSFDTEELHGRLKAGLPDYMVPGHFMVLDGLPLTPNGKINRKALPAPDLRQTASFSQPATPAEDLLATLWAGVLKREAIGRRDNFFELGGHSLLATRLIARIRESFQVELPIRAVFEHPRLSDLASAIEAATGGIRLPAIEAQAADAPGVLSFAQQRLWFLNQFEGNNSATYNMPVALRLSGQLDVSALQQSLHWLMERHAGLRCHFPTIAGQAQVHIRALDAIEALSIHDLRPLPADDREREVLRLANSHAVAPFDLEQGPLFRADLLRLDETGAVLLLNMHHIISDGWSMGVFMRDWQHAYIAFAEGGRPALPELAIQYSDYAAWQRQWFQGEVLQRQIDYWTGQLNGLPELLELPTDKPRPPQQSYQGAHFAHSLPVALSQAVARLSVRQGVTVFMTLLAAFEVLLSRYSGRQDLAVGSPIANRTHARTEDLIGFFVNTLVLRGRLDPQQSFAGLLQATRQTCLEAYAHQDIPFEMLVENLQPTRSLSHSPLFQVMFVLQNDESAESALPDVAVSLLEAEYPVAKFDLTLNVAERDGQLQCYWEYATDLFAGDTIKRMAEHFETLLNAVVDNPQRTVGRLPMLMEQEIRQLQAWNDTATDYPKDRTIVDSFERQVEATPDTIAVVFEDQSLSYRQLNERSNQLAHHLLGLKTEAGTALLADNPLIAIAVERSLEMVIGLLGILKAGGAYVPVDSHYPAVRIRHMLEDSRAPLLLTQSRLQGQLPPPELEQGCVVLCLDELDVAGQSIENPARRSGPEDLAYVMYTSGSTGMPKGVCIAHTAVIRLVKNTNYIQINADDCIAQASNVSFDAATFEIWGSLLNGARLVGIPKDTLLSPHKLKEHLRSRHINTLFVTPALFNQIAQTKPDCFETLKHLLLGGEQLDPHWVNAVLRNHPPQRLLNVYGPTEATTFASWYVVKSGQRPDDIHTIPIGRPIGNTRIFTLNPQHQLQSPHIPGELCIAGVGLARGYLNRPELSAEKFIEVELFGKQTRIYKTGDLARWLPDGNLEFLGRIDRQIKLRGFRIELGEIEAVLCQYPDVKDIVANLYEADGDKRIVAYLTTDNGSFSTDALRGWLKARLPDYMVPSHFMRLDSLPLTPNGKIDRKALPEPDVSIQAEQQMPHTETEHLLCSLWSHVLRLEVTSISSNFFEAGGHSLLATQLVSRIRESFGIEMPLRTVFEYPLLREQAEWLDRRQRGSELPAVLPLAEGEAAVLSFAQQRLWFLTQLEGQSATYNMPTALRLEGRLHEDALQSALIALMRRHETLRLCFPMVDGKPSVQRNEIYNPLSVTDLSGLSDAEQKCRVAERVAAHADAPFDLGAGPLFKLHLLRLGSEKHILLFNMHHIIGDGWSTGVMIRDWCRLYEAYVHNREPQLPELPIQYTDYAAWQRKWLQGAVLVRQLDYWTDKLSGVPELLELPADSRRPAVRSYRGRHLQSTLNPALTQAIKTLGRKQGVTDFMALLAAFTVLLSRYSEQTDIVVGCPIANRTQSQTENLIGFFVNTLALRLQLNAEQSFSELLRQVRKTALEAYSHQDIPFEALVEKINPSRSLSHSPLFQVMFVLQNTPEEVPELSGLNITPIESEHATAKFDLTLSVEEQGGAFVCNWEYNTDLFGPQTIARMTERFQVLLEGIVCDPEQSIAQLPLLTIAEQQLLQAWNRTGTDYPEDLTLVDLFQTRAVKTPDAIAVVFEDQQLTYRRLNEQANQLAHYLLDLKVDNRRLVSGNCLIGICVERSLEMIIGLLAILKAGAAYVPLDPDYPQQRLQFILEDACVPVLLAQSHLLERLPALNTRVVCMDQEREPIADCSAHNPARQSGPDDLAYVIYTSGSTGKPKGCQVTQANVTRLFAATDEWYRFNSQDVWTLFHSYAFDFSVWEIWGALFYGGKLVVVPYGTSRTPALFYQLLIEQGVTVLNQTPSAFRQLQDVDEQPDKLCLRLVIFGGEALDFAALQPWFSRHGDRHPRLVNMYGITETTVHVTYYPLAAGENGGKSIIGTPIPDLQVWVVDACNNLLPIGVPGEMLVGGAGVARGYLNRPELTAERFIEIELFGKRQRVYKSGDLARWLPDGNIEYLGRKDNQVKIRGFRIELGEIEACLMSNPAVKEAVVLVSGEDEAKALTAYLTSSSVLKAEELREALNALLPGYMVPAYFVQMDALPLLPNGKINRKSLIGLKPIESSREYRPPQNDLESELLSIWKKYLEAEDISTNANFFEVGGNSLSLVRVHWEIEKNHPQTTLMDLFAHPNIADLALFLSGGKNRTRIEIETLPLDEKYFSTGDGGLLEYTLDKALAARLNERENPDVRDILRASFGYLLFEISSQSEVPFYAALNDKQILCLRHDYEAIDSIEELLQASRSRFLDPKEIYPLDNFLKTGANPGSRSVLPLYSDSVRCDFDNADLHWHTDTNNGTVNIAFRFSSRMDREAMKLLPGLYVAILEAIIKEA